MTSLITEVSSLLIRLAPKVLDLPVNPIRNVLKDMLEIASLEVAER